MFSYTRLMITRNLLRRNIHTTSYVQAVERSPLFLLRQKTGLAYSLCREALNKHENNVDEAEAWLKAHAMAHGLQKASKVRDRSTREGLVCLSVPRDNSFTTIVELNCETDFVAKNQLFKDFALGITEQISLDYNNSTEFSLPEQDQINGLKPSEALVKDIENQIVPLISKLGENIKLARAMHLQSANGDESIKLFGQIHAQAANKLTSQRNIMAGRFGATIALKLTEEAMKLSHDSIKPLGNRLCQHVIGYNPSFIELPANIRKHLEAVEEERMQNRTSVEVETNEGLSDQEGCENSTNNHDEWPSMMDQTLIMTDNLIVRDFCEANNISIVYFNRFECGMESW